MSRFSEGDEFDSEEAEQAYFKRVNDGYYKAIPQLRVWLSYLDAMPKKAIIENRFVEPQTGDMCAIASYCAARGFDQKQLWTIERQSEIERKDNRNEGEDYGEGDGGHGYDGATVRAGVEAGLPQIVAYEIGFKNDMNWRKIIASYVASPNGRSYNALYREIAPSERWLILRNFIAKKLGETILPGQVQNASKPPTPPNQTSLL